MNKICRHCAEYLKDQIIDLGHHPPSNNYLSFDELNNIEYTYPLKLYICKKCGLVQLPEILNPRELFKKNYPYFSSTSTSWCKHAEVFVKNAIKNLSLNQNSFVIEIASNDGYLLQHVKDNNIPCLGIEPTKATAEESRKKGIKTIEKFFNFKLSQDLEKADLVIANNVIAHVPDINDFMKGISMILKNDGRATIEFPHLLNLVKFNQFDTIYHEHYSYLSLNVLQKIASTANLEIIDVEKLETHGGSLRVWITHKNRCKISKKVKDILLLENSVNLMSLNGFYNFKKNVEKIKYDLIKYLIESKEKNEKVIGYGAAAKGNTLLNYAGIKEDLIEYIVDKANSKQNLFTPGSHIPIKKIDFLEIDKPDKLLVLPWNLIKEICMQQKDFKLITAIPYLQIFK